jgi:divalent metal cation (Fe/Co/Zn/Cd) transporter
MSTHAPTVAVSHAQPSGEHGRLVHRARTLSLLSIGWMSVEAAVAIIAALLARSVALIGFGLDSLIEMASAGAILWLSTGTRSASPSAERRAQQLVALCFAALAVYLLGDAITTLSGRSHPLTSWPGLAISLAAIAVMPLLARAKARVAAQLGSAAVAGDAAQSWLCAVAAAAVLVSVVANAALSWWWLDPIAGIAIAGLAVHEGRETWAGDVCGECLPVAAPRTNADSQCDESCGS